MRDRIAVAVTASSSSAFEAARDVVAIAVGKDSALLAATTPRKSVMNHGTDKRRRSGRVVSPAAGPIQSDASSTAGANMVTRASFTMVA